MEKLPLIFTLVVLFLSIGSCKKKPQYDTVMVLTVDSESFANAFSYTVKNLRTKEVDLFQLPKHIGIYYNVGDTFRLGKSEVVEKGAEVVETGSVQMISNKHIKEMAIPESIKRQPKEMQVEHVRFLSCDSTSSDKWMYFKVRVLKNGKVMKFKHEKELRQQEPSVRFRVGQTATIFDSENVLEP